METRPSQSGRNNRPSVRRPGGVVPAVIATFVLILLAWAFLFPAVRRPREVARRSSCKNNLKQIAVALHNYHDKYGSFPPAYTVDDYGQPLHSWRTLILPEMGQTALYDKIDLAKPWNDPANKAVFDQLIDVYQCPSANGPKHHTTYMAVVAKGGSFFPADQPREIREITDGTANTLLVLEVPPKHSVPWMAPRDVDEELILGISPDPETTWGQGLFQSEPEQELPHTGGFQAAFADGSVRFIPANLPAAQRKALISAAGGDDPGKY